MSDPKLNRQYDSSPIKSSKNRLATSRKKKNRGSTIGMKEWGKKYKSNPVKKGRGHRINFFFLGDLVEAACAIIHKRPEIKQGCPPSLSGKQSKFQREMWKQVRVILGTIRIRNPGEKLKDNNDIRNICLADVPIASSTFQAFWNSEVYALGRTNYPLPEFLLDICIKLIPIAIDKCIFGGRIQGLDGTSNLYQYRLPAKDVLDEIWEDGKEKRITLDQITEARWEAPEKGSISEFHEYFHLQGPIASPNFLSVQGRKTTIADKLVYNDKHGIPTFYIGNNVGLLRKVSFVRMKTPTSLIMENIAKNADSSGASLVMADLYSCKVELFGNPILMNGMYIYLNPRSLGLPDKMPESLVGQTHAYKWADNVGLGGYYNIGKVKHRIDHRGYFTTLTAVPDNAQVGFEKANVETPKKPSTNPLRGSI